VRALAPARPWLIVPSVALALAALAGCDAAGGGLPPLDADVKTGDTTSGRPSVDGELFAGTASLTSKADEARFAGVTTIDGDLVVTAQDSAGIRLDDLEVVTGSIRVVGKVGTEASGNLTLPRLTRVGGNIVFAYTHSVGTIDLPNLRTVGGHVDLGHGIFDLEAGRLETINGDLRLRDVGLVAVDLSALTSLGGALRATRYSTSAAGGSLSLTFPSLRAIGGDIDLSAGATTYLVARRLATLAGDIDLTDLAVGVDLPNLVSVDGEVRLTRLDAFTLSLDSLVEVSGDVSVTGSGGVGIVSLALPRLAAVGGRVTFTDLADTEAIRLPALTDLGAALTVTLDSRLTTLSVTSLPILHSDLIVTDNGQALLVDLPALSSVGGNLELQRTGGVDARLGALATVTGDLRVAATPINRLGLPALTAVGRHLVISDVTCNDGVVAFPLLATIGGDLEVVRATWLSSLLAPALTHVGSVAGGFPFGDLRVESNPDLAALTLPALEAVEGHVSVRHNALLESEDVAATFATVTVGGEVTLCGNLEGEVCP
jgi:hypothetical protein